MPKNRVSTARDRERAATWWDQNKEYANLARNAKKFNIPMSEYLRLSKERFCYICGGDPDGRWNKLNLDHDHTTGQIRKMLCGKCNKTLGLVSDNIATLEAMIDYLKEHQ